MQLVQGFIPFGQRQLFLATAGTSDVSNKGSAVLVLPAFGDEMNKSRHLVRQLMQALAAQGLASFSLDAWGTGDSEGCLSQVTALAWQQDLRALVQRLADEGYQALRVVAVRFGALQLWDLLASGQPNQPGLALPIEKVVLWQPYWQHSVFLQQLFRLKVAEQMAAGGKTTQKELEQLLAQGDLVEIGGYPITADWVSSIRALTPLLQTTDLTASNTTNQPNTTPTNTSNNTPTIQPKLPVLWLETSLNEHISTANQKTLNQVTERFALQYQQVQGPTWWSAAELVAMPNLLESSVKFLVESAS